MLDRYYEAFSAIFGLSAIVTRILLCSNRGVLKVSLMGEAPHKLDKTLVLVRLMGCGKSSVGRRLAARLGVEFVDTDDEIAKAAGMCIPEIFEKFGERGFRDGEVKVISRLLADEPRIMATGGGAFMSPLVRAEVERTATSVWLRASLDTLWARVKGKPGRPLLENDNPKQVLADLLVERTPIYSMADVVVDTIADNTHETVVNHILAALADFERIEEN